MAIQTLRPIEVRSPLGPDTLLFRRMVATEQLGRLSNIELDLLSDDPDIKLHDVVGLDMSVRMDLAGAEERFFHGFVSRFSLVGRSGRYAWYQATLRPWLWFLTRTADCRIFQHQTVPEILQEVFRGNGFSFFADQLRGNYKPREYCVQYRETDFNFASRLMEEEGIYYYVEHDADRNTIVLCDDYGSHKQQYAGYEKISYRAPEDEAPEDQDHIGEWTASQVVQPAKYVLNSFDFMRPKADLKVEKSIARQHAHAEYEVYDYAPDYTQSGDGENYVRTRIEEFHAEYEQLHGAGNARGIAVGRLFELSDFPRADQNREYLVVSVTHEIDMDGYEATSDREGTPIHNVRFTCIDAKEHYRSPRITPRPAIQGPQTAIVVGKKGEEMWTDAQGRVKLQFHWDRYGKGDENSSCWVRVSSPWAGQNWGGIHIPRIGQEVIVEFLEGNPDRPIITGRVYNGDNPVPYELPKNQTQSGIKSRSSKGGGKAHFNEIRMEDKKGAEQLYIHAEKDQVVVVENDKTESVGHDETITIDRHRTETVKGNETLTVESDRKRKVAKNETVEIGENRKKTVGKDETIIVKGDRTATVEHNETVTVKADRKLTIGGSETFKVDRDASITVGGNRQLKVGQSDTIDVGKTLTLEAGNSVVLKSGRATITLKKDGTIEISGVNIKITAMGKLDAKATSPIALKAPKVVSN